LPQAYMDLGGGGVGAPHPKKIKKSMEDPPKLAVRFGYVRFIQLV
jgi:hypothetical protein